MWETMGNKRKDEYFGKIGVGGGDKKYADPPPSKKTKSGVNSFSKGSVLSSIGPYKDQNPNSGMDPDGGIPGY